MREMKEVFFFKQKTAYEMRISDWSSDVCSSDLAPAARRYWAWQRRGYLKFWTWQVTVAASGGAFPLFWAGAIVRSEDPALSPGQIGRASCRERVCQYV